MISEVKETQDKDKQIEGLVDKDWLTEKKVYKDASG